jgi:hypothetical protein
MSTPALPLTDTPAPRASEYAQQRFAHLGLTPEELAAEDLDLSPPLSAEEQAEFLADAATWATPAELERLRIEVTPLTDEARAELLAAVDEAPVSEAFRESVRRDVLRA